MGGDRFRNKQLSLFELLSQGKRCKLYVLHCILYKLVSPELADLGIPPPRVKTETYYRKSTSGCRALGQRAQVSPLPALTFTRILFERPPAPAPSGLLRPCRGETGPAQTLTGEMTQFCDICETPVQMSNVLSVECQVTGKFVKPEQSMVSNDGDWIS